MSNLKHLTVPELLKELRTSRNRVNYHAGKVSGEQERIKWIEHYLKEKGNEQR